MPITKDDILERIQKLLAVASNAGATENEAEVAAAIARRLMDEHEITVEQIEAAKLRGEDQVVDESIDVRWRRAPDWVMHLAGGIAQGFDCRAYRTLLQGENGTVGFIGFAADAAVASYLFRVVVEQLPKLAEKAAGRRFGATRRLFMSSFLIAAANAVGLRLQRERKASAAGLIVAKNAMIDASGLMCGGKPRETRVPKSLDDSAAWLGHAAGSSICLATNVMPAPAAAPRLAN